MASIAIFTTSAAQQPSYIGETDRHVVEIKGSSWLDNYTAIGWSIGAYSDAPGKKDNAIVLYNVSDYRDVEVPAGSKFIIKVNGEPMVLQTEHGTFYDGSHSIIDRGPRYNLLYTTTVYYEVTQEQADLINKYGISKFRYQIDNKVLERDNMNSEKIARKMKRAYDRISDRQDAISRKMEDISDF